MKGKPYILFSSILIIVGGVAGLILNISTSLLPAYCYTRITTIICMLFLLTGILGLIFRNKAAFVCYVFGFLLCALSILSIPFMFWIGRGTAPLGLLLAGFVYFIIFGLYLTGISLNKKAPRKEIHFIPYDYVPLNHNS